LVRERKLEARALVKLIECKRADQQRSGRQETHCHARARQTVDFGISITGCLEVHLITPGSMYSSKFLVTDFYKAVDFEVLR
jgi:hypothetical protein